MSVRRDVRILHIADPHVDAGEDGRKAHIEALLAQEFDYVVCTGDVANTKGPFRRFLEWFDDDDRPRYFVPGNHDYWAFKHDRWLLPKVREHGWKTLETENHNWAIIDDILLVGLWYTPQPLWGAVSNSVAYTADSAYFDVRRHIRKPALPGDAPKVRFSIGHVSPSDRLFSRYRPHMMFVNPLVLDLVKAHGSPLHLYGHTHERIDAVVDGVRCVNRSMSDRMYRLSPGNTFVEMGMHSTA